MGEYIFSKSDFRGAIRGALDDMFGSDLNEIIADKTIVELERYVNVKRFYDRNCCGCVCGNDECDFAFGRNEAKGAWKMAVRGKLFDCPVRVNGTMTFDTSKPEEGIQSIDISDRDDPPYPTVELPDGWMARKDDD